MSLHYLNQEYQPGLIFEQLQCIEHDMVIGIDIGHGECMAYVYRKKDNGWEPEVLNVTPEYEHQIPSYIAYDDKGNGKKDVIIGKDASLVAGGFYVYFKQEPAKWGTRPGKDAPTYGQLLKDYISVLWNNIWIYNDMFRNVINPVKKEDILVVIGCPASGSWTELEHMREYVKLVQEATDCKKVAILAESTAAIMTPIYLKKAVDLGNGVAIYDFGSSTLDFTYILMGKILLTASIPLGGSDVDRAMMRYVLKKNNLSSDVKQYDQQSMNVCYTKLRAAKETYYNANQTDLRKQRLEFNQKLNYWLDDAVLKKVLSNMNISFDGKLLKDVFEHVDAELVDQTMFDLILRTYKITNIQLSADERSEIYTDLSNARKEYLTHNQPGQYSISVEQSVPYTVDKTMMDSVITADTAVSMNKLDANYSGKTWKDCVETFFTITKLSIGTKPCGTVILTGGTSKIADVRKVAASVYNSNDVIIHEEEDTSATVAKGLCLAKGHEVSAAEKIESLKKELYRKTTSAYFPGLCEGFGKGELFDCIWAKLIRSIKEIQCEMEDMEQRGDLGISTYRQFKETLEKKLSSDAVFLNMVKKAFVEYIDDYMKPALWKEKKKPHCIEPIREAANQLAVEIYQAKATTVPQVSAGMISSLAGGINDEILLAVVKETSLARAVQKIVVDHMYVDKKSVAGRFQKMAKRFSLKFESKISLEDVKNMCKAMETAEKEDYRGNLGFQFRLGLQYSDAFKEMFQKLIDQQFEVAIGIILFQVFDN